MTHQRKTVGQEAEAFLSDSDELWELLHEAQVSLTGARLLAHEVGTEEWGATCWQRESEGALSALRETLGRLQAATGKVL